MTRVLVVGDALLDVDVEGRAERLAPDAPVPVVQREDERARPGGAGLAALLAARDGARVTLLTALGDDAAGRRLRRLLQDEGIDVVDLGRAGATVQKTRILAGGRPVVRLDAGTPGSPRDPGAVRLPDADALLVSDYGLGVTALPGLRAALAARARDGVPVVWDPHPRGSAPVAGCAVATPNAAEAAGMAPARQDPDDGVATPDDGPVPAACRAGEALVRTWAARNVCVTVGEDGAVLVPRDGVPLVVAPDHRAHGDPCGAGDRFASRLALALGDGRPVGDAVRAAVTAAAAFVGRGGARGGGPTGTRAAPGRAEERSPATRALRLADEVRGRGGTVVATGGCFDLLHAGHVESLQAARALGDLLVVCLNADASVARLKGPGRPVVPEGDRAAVLRGLGCVDEVVVFAEDTPIPLLRRLRPHLFVKGGDYRAPDLPETPVLAGWGGRVVTVPLVAGRSTTSILQEVRRVA